MTSAATSDATNPEFRIPRNLPGPVLVDQYRIDIDESGLVTFSLGDFGSSTSSSSETLTFTDALNGIADIIGFDLLSTFGGTTGIAAADFTFTANTATMQVGIGAAFPNNPAGFTARLRFAQQVPEPAPLALVAVGLQAAGLGSRRKQGQKTAS